MRVFVLDLLKKSIVEIVLKKYSQKEISLGMAAELAKMSISDFIKKAAEKKIPVNYAADSLEKDFKAALDTR